MRRGSRYVVQARLVNPPKRHLGRPLEKVDPISICATAFRYYCDLVFEARQRFSEP